MTRWFYRQDGEARGPCTAAELRELIASGSVRKEDPVWPEGGDPAHAVAASAVPDLAGAFAAPALPDWLADVAKLETTGPAAPALAGGGVPAWLADLRLWYQLEPAGTPVTREQSAAETFEPPSAETVARETGFDPQTGRVIDPERFARWTKEQGARPARPAPRYASLVEALRAGCNAISREIDDPSYKELILQGAVQVLRVAPRIDAVFEEHKGYGRVLDKRLRQHLEFMVENRRKHYLARGTG